MSGPIKGELRRLAGEDTGGTNNVSLPDLQNHCSKKPKYLFYLRDIGIFPFLGCEQVKNFRKFGTLQIGDNIPKEKDPFHLSGT